MSWYRNPLNIRVHFRERLWFFSVVPQFFLFFFIFFSIQSLGTCIGGSRVCTCLWSQTSSTLGGSWKFAQLRKIVLSPLSFIYLFVVMVVVVLLVLLVLLVVPFVLYLCKKFICCCWKISACGPRTLTDQGQPGQVSVCFFTPFLVIGLPAHVNAFLGPNCTDYFYLSISG